MPIHKLTLELTWSQAERIVTELRARRDFNEYQVSRTDWLQCDYWQNPETAKYERNPNVEPRVKESTVEHAEAELLRRAELNEVISFITGEPEPEPYADNVAEGRRQLDAQEAATVTEEV